MNMLKRKFKAIVLLQKYKSHNSSLVRQYRLKNHFNYMGRGTRVISIVDNTSNFFNQLLHRPR